MAAIAALSVVPVAGAKPAQIRILSPAHNALAVKKAVRVKFRARGGAVQVIVDNRDVTKRFKRVKGGRPAKGSLYVGTLRRGKQIRRGFNRLVVGAGKGGDRRYAARRFFVGKRRPGTLKVSRRRHGDAALAVRVQAAKGQTFRHVRVWLNGKRVRTKDWVAGERTPSSRWPRGRRAFRALFGADDGLRFGRNRLRITAWNEHGIYDSVTRTVRIGAKAPLVGAGKGRTLRVKRKVRLDGRSTKHRRGTRVVYRWRIVGKPRGSKARLKRAGSARPVLLPDVHGTYRVRLTAKHVPAAAAKRKGRGAGRASASAAGPAAVDEVTVEAKPPIAPIGTPIQTINQKGAIQLLGREYSAEPGAWVQILALDRETLEVKRHISLGQASAVGSSTVEELSYTLSQFDERTLLILSGGNRRASLAAPDQVEEEKLLERFIEALNYVGDMAGGMGNMWKPTVQRAVSEGRWSLIGVPGSRGIATHNLIGAIYGMRPSEGWAPGRSAATCRRASRATTTSPPRTGRRSTPTSPAVPPG